MSKRFLIFVAIGVLGTMIVLLLLFRILFSELNIEPGAKAVQNEIEHSKSIKSVSQTPTPVVQEKQDENSIEETVDISQIRQLLDESMSILNGKYVAHQEVVSGPNTSPVVSFLYILDNEDSDTDSDSIQLMVGSALQMREQAQDLMAEALDQEDTSKINSAGALLVNADKELVQEDTFVNIEIATSKDMAPVQMFQKGLPDWIIFQRTALDLANQYFNENTSLQEVRRSGFGRYIFVCKSASGSLAYIDACAGKIYSKETLVQLPQRHRQKSEEEKLARSERIRQQWDEFLKQGVNVKKFSLNNSDLEDLSKMRR